MEKRRIAIVDYGMGNLFSVSQACEKAGMHAFVSSEIRDITEADAIILPGVGAFGDAMNNLIKLDLTAPIIDHVASGKPFMGICLGMQLLFTESEEFGQHKGLNILEGKICKFPVINTTGTRIKVPQIGWNQVWKPEHRTWENTPFSTLKDGEYMYFVHSYYAVPSDQNNVLCSTNYEDLTYCSGVQKNNIFALQFHPEKSAESGLLLFKEFLKTIEENAAV